MAENGRRNADSALILAIAGGASVRDAAKQTGVSERTIHRRLEDPAFRKRVDDARAEMVAGAVGTLARASTAAATTLEALLAEDQRPNTRLSAARAILELGSRLREAEELEQRIARLEEAISSQGRSIPHALTRRPARPA